MKQYNFDEIIDRRGTDCVKYDGMAETFGGRQGLTPLWVADMDFATPDFIVEALKRRCTHPIFGSSVAYLYPWDCQGDCFRPPMLYGGGRPGHYPAPGISSIPAGA